MLIIIHNFIQKNIFQKIVRYYSYKIQWNYIKQWNCSPIVFLLNVVILNLTFLFYFPTNLMSYVIYRDATILPKYLTINYYLISLK